MVGQSWIVMASGFKTSRTSFCNRVGTKKSHAKLDLALNDCQRIDECVGIYDENCDGKGEFEVCEDERKISNGLILGSCIYSKGTGKSTQKNIIIEVCI